MSVCRNEGSLPSTYNQLKTCIGWLAPTYSTDETVLAFSDQTFETASGGDTGDTISTVSKSRSLITNTSDLIKNFLLQKLSATGA